MMEQEISDLRKACDSMADEVTKLTKGTGLFQTLKNLPLKKG